MQKTKTVSRFSWRSWFGKSAAPKAARPVQTDSHSPIAEPLKIAGAKVRATPKSGKITMQNLAQFRSIDISRAFKQAPWRVQLQLIASLAAGAIVIVALGGLYLTEASRAATAGRDVQTLQVQKAELEFAIDRQTSLIAQAKSVSRLEKRARELGYAPAVIEQIDFILVEGYYGPRLGLPTETTPPVAPALPNYNETLGTWLANQLSFVFGSGG